MGKFAGKTDKADKGEGNIKSKNVAKLVVLAFFVLFFFGIFVLFGTPLYNDSDQYIAMHVHREPVYPLFLYVIRCITPAHFMSVASILQSVLCIYASYTLVSYVADTFDLKPSGMAVCSVIAVVPYIITPLFSKLHIQLSVAIMSESVAFPLFILFIVVLHRAFVSKKRMSMFAAFLIALLLTLTRSQMIFTFILWFIMAVIMLCTGPSDASDKTGSEKVIVGRTADRIMGIIICIIIMIAGFAVRDVATRTYNYVFNGRYIDSVYSHINLLANILYVSDRDDLDDCPDENLREIYVQIYDKADEQGYLCNSVGDSLTERVVYLEEVHDRIKYDCIEYGLRDIVEESTGIHEYIEYNRIADAYAGDMIRILLPKVFGKWAADAFLLGTRGLVRNVAVCHPVMYIYVAVVIIGSICGVVFLLRRAPQDKTAWFMIIALLAVFGNSYSTALVIMCLSRYMIYGFPVFYTGLFLLIKRGVNLKMIRSTQDAGSL